MKRIMIISILLIALLTQAVGNSYAQAEELIVNGGFEYPVVDTSTYMWDIYPSGTEGLGWQVEWYGGATEYLGIQRPQVAYLEFHNPGALWPVYEGDQYAELDSDWPGPYGMVVGEPSSIRISQDIQTYNGGSYRLMYSWSPRPNSPENAMEVWWGDTLVATHSGTGTAQTMWMEEIRVLTATSRPTKLSFVETGVPDGLGMFLDDVSLVQVTTNPGTGTPGYWKNHPAAWPVDAITIGGVTYTKAEAIFWMSKSERGDKTFGMFRALVAAELNVMIGNDSSCIEDTIADADAWMSTYGPVGSRVSARSEAWRAGEPLFRLLDQYNNGLLCAPRRG
jgi:hypothetical protein